MIGILYLVRHGESEWNTIGKWTGWANPSLTEKGRDEARKAGEALKNKSLNEAYCSVLSRAKETLDEILTVLDRKDMPTVFDEALNERDYGIYTGKIKWEVKEEVGEEQFMAIRRGFDTQIPEGENLRQVCERVHPYYLEEILPKLQSGKHVVVSAHHNSLRALIKFIESISDEDAPKIEMKTGEIIQYSLNDEGKMTEKEFLNQNEDAGLQ